MLQTEKKYVKGDLLLYWLKHQPNQERSLSDFVKYFAWLDTGNHTLDCSKRHDEQFKENMTYEVSDPKWDKYDPFACTCGYRKCSKIRYAMFTNFLAVYKETYEKDTNHLFENPDSRYKCWSFHNLIGHEKLEKDGIIKIIKTNRKIFCKVITG